LCEECVAKLKPEFADECHRCGAPVGRFTDVSDGCIQCRRESFAFDRVIRLGVYHGDMRAACLRAKANGGSGIAYGLANALCRQKQSAFIETSPQLVIPVPEHWTRRLLHHHYAAESFSRQIAHHLNVPWNRSMLFKKHRTPKQATSPIVQRRQQQTGSFGVRHGQLLDGKTVLLVDDILTTGSTASAAAKELKRAGAKQVVVAVIAVSPLT
jgi:predicted amidophosphoribosyltransferase